MIIAAGFLFGIAFFWAFGAVFFLLIQDLPLGGVNMRLKGKAYRESERRVIEGNHPFAKFWRARLWPVALASVVGAVVLLAIVNP
jgi:hypothetical protein